MLLLKLHINNNQTLSQQSWCHLFHYAIPLHWLANYQSNIKVHAHNDYVFKLFIFSLPVTLVFASCLIRCSHIWVCYKCKILNFWFHSISCLLCPSMIKEQSPGKCSVTYCKTPQAGAFWAIGMPAFQTKKRPNLLSRKSAWKLLLTYMEAGLCSWRGHVQMQLWSLQCDHSSRVSDRSKRPEHPATLRGYRWIPLHRNKDFYLWYLV